jgi:cytochrome P450
MAQLTIYLSEPAAREARRRARRRGKSLSAYIAELLERETARHRWPRDLVALLREGKGDLVEPDDPPPEPVERIR